MDRARRSTTVRQLELLVKFAEENTDLALGRLRSKEARVLLKRLWRGCAVTLNSAGPSRLPREWAKVWNDLKCRVRSKLTSLTSQRGAGNGKLNITLTGIEARVANIIGRDVGPNPNVAQDPLAGNQDVSTDSDRMSPENYDGQLAGPLFVGMSPKQSQSPIHPPESPTQPPESPIQPPESSTQPPPSQSGTSAPWRRLRLRQSLQRPLWVTAQTSQTALDESRVMMMRIEELRARTDNMLAQSALRQAETAKALAEAALISAEANRVHSQTLSTLSSSLISLVPAINVFLESNSQRRSSLDADVHKFN